MRRDSGHLGYHQFGLDAFIDGKWQHVKDYPTLQSAIDAANALDDEPLFSPEKIHAHVWWKGDCRWDSHPGEPEP